MENDNRTMYERFEDTLGILGISNKYIGNTYEVSSSKNNFDREFYFENFKQLKKFIEESDKILSFDDIKSFTKVLESKIISKGFDLDSSFGLKIS